MTGGTLYQLRTRINRRNITADPSKMLTPVRILLKMLYMHIHYVPQWRALVLLDKFNDAIKAGDGDCFLRCWKNFLPLFKATERTNYSIEALHCYSSTALCLHPGCMPSLNGAEL